MKVSIMMPAFNSGRFVAVSIESARAQSFDDWELIVVDDGSTDDTGTIADGYAAKDPRIRVFHQPNGRLPAARNTALREVDAASEYIAFLDSDDVWEGTALERLVSVLDANPGAVGAHGVQRYIDTEGRAIRVDGAAITPTRRRKIDGWLLRTIDVTAPTTFATLAYGNCIPMSGVLVRHAAIAKAGAFDSAMDLVTDWDMWLRMALQGDFVFLNEVMYGYRLHDANISGDSDRKNKLFHAVRRKIYALPLLTTRQRRSVSLGHRYYELYRARVAARKAIRGFRKGNYRRMFTDSRRFVRHCMQAIQGL
jgi:glycosyltransferase involved in cell wall biosynthesis